MLKVTKTIIILLTFICTNLHAQEDFKKSFSLGTNLIKISDNTIDIIVDYHFTKNLDFSINSGYEFNSKGLDLSMFLTGLCKCDNDGFTIQEQKGWYIKLGARYNLTRDYNSKFYFFAGAYLANSFIHS